MGILDDNRVLDMTDEEIKRNVLGAADQKAQVKIVDELNATTEDVIRERLKAQGVDLRRLRGAAKKHIAEAKRHYKKPEIIPGPPVEKPAPEEESVPKAFEVLFNRVSELLKQKAEVQAVCDKNHKTGIEDFGYGKGYIDKYQKQGGGEGQSNKIKKFYAYDENVQTVSPQPAYQQPQTSVGWKAGSF